jgi:transketolase
MILSIKELEKAAMEIRINLLRLCNRQVIHIGGDLSITDVMTVLWQYKMNYDPNDVNYEFRDRFVLSKGHASAVMSFNQAAIGCFKADDVYIPDYHGRGDSDIYNRSFRTLKVGIVTSFG